MGLRTLMRSSTTLVATTVVAALLTAPGAHAHVCVDCDVPEIPDDPGVPCPTIAATADPRLLAPTSPTRPVVGQQVSASTGAWNGNTKTLQARWYVGGKPVGDLASYANTATRTMYYTVRAEDQNKSVRLWVRGTGTNSPCIKDEFSTSTALVDLGPKPVNQSAPSVSGTARVGQELRVSPGSWTNSPESYSYAWYREGTGESIAHGQRYTLTADDLDKRIRVGVTAERPGHWVGFEYSEYTVAITPGSLHYDSVPTITGTTIFGQTLTGTDGQWPDGTTITSRTWQSGSGGVVASGSDEYTLGLDDLGQRMHYSVRATRPGYHPRLVTVSTDSSVARAAAPVWRGKKLALKGTDKVKKKAKVALGVKRIRLRAKAPGANVTYQWLRNGKVVKKSTAKAHTITKADVKKKLKARITITRRGHKPLVITTRAVKIKNSGKRIR